MCSLARSYYRGNRTQKSTAITAKLFVLLIDIFSEIHKAASFPTAPAQRRPPAPPPPACGAGTSGTAQCPSRSTYTYRQSTAFWPPDAPCASPKRAIPAAAAQPAGTGRCPAAPAVCCADSLRTAAESDRGICTYRQCIMSCFRHGDPSILCLPDPNPLRDGFSICRRFANVKCELYLNFQAPSFFCV